MGLISRAWTNLAPPGTLSPLGRPDAPLVSDEPSRFIHDVSEDDLLQVSRVVSCARARDCAGDDLHRQANYPSQHCNYCPEDVWIFTKHNHADRYESSQCREKCAYGAEKFCRINLSAGAIFCRPAIWCVKSQRRSINSQVEPDCATNHHDDQKQLRRERRDAGPHMDGNKQSACRSSQRKPNAFQDVGGLSYAELHRRNPPGAKALS